VFDWCYHLNITTITAYAFSTENFKRDPEEVGALMDLARQKFREMLQEGYVSFLCRHDFAR
jgi:undecaprenyl diphosphate synthase